MPRTDTLAATLAGRSDADRVRLRLGTIFIEHASDLWPEGEPAATPEWIRANVDDILAALERPLRHDGHDVRRLPHRLHWLLWELAEIERRSTPM
jgi:hypothetical protein